MLNIFKKSNTKRQTLIGKIINENVGFTLKKHLETNIPVTDFLKDKEDFLWKCVKNLPKLKYEKINFLGGDKKHLIIDENTKVFFRFWTLRHNMEDWWQYVDSADFCLVYKEKPVITIRCNTPQGQRQIMVEYSEVILPFIDSQIKICGQYGAGYSNISSDNDIGFYFLKYQNKSEYPQYQNNYLTSDNLLHIMEKFVIILEDIWVKNAEILEENKNWEQKEAVKTKEVKLQENLETVFEFIK